MDKHVFIARIPDEAGSLRKATEVIKKYDGNISRLQFDRRIDPYTVFFRILATREAYAGITRDLKAMRYLQTSLKPLSFLKFSVYIDHNRPGALLEFLNYTTDAGANIAFIDFDGEGRHPDRLSVSLNLDESEEAERLLDRLKTRYRMEILEYDHTGRHLDDTVFYLRYAQSVRELIGNSEEEFLLSFLADINHIAQELMDLGNDPQQVFANVLASGQTMRATTGDGFYAEVQAIDLGGDARLFCFQPPCGGSIFVLESEGDRIMIDTGYGIYHDDVMRMLTRYGLGTLETYSQVIVTHADADHCGAAGYFTVPVLLHRGTQAIVYENNRGYRSMSENSVLEKFYTKMINFFSFIRPPLSPKTFPEPSGVMRSPFPVLGTIGVGSIQLEILESLGGHIYGQIFLYSRDSGLLFTADSLINFASLTPERAKFSSLAAFLVTSVNVDSVQSKKEREGLLALDAETDAALSGTGKRCLICGGHGAISVAEGKSLAVYGTVARYELNLT
jgi:glyoxylase-like metal-dependent hydrolase (beta-lactamase superfamily II)/uncharacterized protein with ACT and thioredoxin-like domain